MNRLLLSAACAMLAAPAFADQPPSDLAVGVAMSQWVVLNCPVGDIPENTFPMLEALIPLIPQFEQDLAYYFVADTVSEMGTIEACNAIILLLNRSTNS